MSTQKQEDKEKDEDKEAYQRILEWHEKRPDLHLVIPGVNREMFFQMLQDGILRRLHDQQMLYSRRAPNVISLEQRDQMVEYNKSIIRAYEKIMDEVLVPQSMAQEREEDD